MTYRHSCDKITRSFATLESCEARAQKYSHSEGQAAAVGLEAMDEVSEGPVPGVAEANLQMCYEAVVITKAVLHL